MTKMQAASLSDLHRKEALIPLMAVTVPVLIRVYCMWSRCVQDASFSDFRIEPPECAALRGPVPNDDDERHSKALRTAHRSTSSPWQHPARACVAHYLRSRVLNSPHAIPAMKTTNAPTTTARKMMLPNDMIALHQDEKIALHQDEKHFRLLFFGGVDLDQTLSTVVATTRFLFQL